MIQTVFNNHKKGNPIKILKRNIFIVAFLCLIVIFHFLDHKKKIVSDDDFIPLGSYGLPFSQMGPKTKKRVILIGNSVFQTTSLVHYLVKLKEQAGLAVEIGNFGMPGSSIGDYIFTYNYVRQFDPDLIIVQMAPFTFGFTDNLYRSEARKLIFSPEMKELRTKQILDTYDKDELVESFFYSYFPLFRMVHINRVRLKRIINNFEYEKFGTNYMKFFPYSLNVVEENGEFVDNVFPHKDQFPKAENMLRFFINQLEADRQQAVFVMQETDYKNLPICLEFESYIKNREQMSYYNFRDFFQKEKYFDHIHPIDAELQRVAARIYRIMVKHLE